MQFPIDIRFVPQVDSLLFFCWDFALNSKQYTRGKMSYTAAETGHVKSIKSKFENLNSLESLDISVTVPNKYRKPSPKFLFKRSSTSIDLPISRIAVANNKRESSIKLATGNSEAKSTHLRRNNNLERTISADTFAVKKRSLIANGEDTLKPLKEIKENVEVRLARHTNDPIKRSSIKRSPAFRVGDKSSCNNNTSSKQQHVNNVKSSPKTDINHSSGKVKTIKPPPPVVPSEFAEKFDSFLKRCDIDTKKDLQDPGLTDTLKAFLRQPLPSGPPPKKPPRTFIDSPKQVQKTTTTTTDNDTTIGNGNGNGSDDDKNISPIQQHRHSPMHCSGNTVTSVTSNDMKQKIDLLETQLVLKTNYKSKSTKMTTTKEKHAFSSSLLNCIPCSSTAIYDTMTTVAQNQFGKVAATSKEPSPEKSTGQKTITAVSSVSTVATTLPSNHRQSASRSHSEPIYMEPFAHLKHKTVNGSTNHCKHGNSNNNNFAVSSPTSSHLSSIEPKLSSSSLSNGSFDGPESIGSSLTSCTSCTADDHSITDLNDIHYMVSFSTIVQTMCECHVYEMKTRRKKQRNTIKSK